ncbi:MAG: nucleotide-binding universal stress UspA family protein [Natronomonas sp.]|jgi:nucleotide-binding universal stress UspA family protein
MGQQAGTKTVSETVLVPVDGSDPADAALEFALETFPDAHLVLYHAINPLPVAREAGTDSAFAEFWSEQFEAAREDARDLLEGAEQRVGETDIDVEIETEIGLPHEVIVEYLDEQPVDHVVIGSHGRTGVSRVVMGSVAEKVVRRSPVPVTIVHGDAAP